MSLTNHIVICSEPLNIETITRLVQCEANGAELIFVGRVRAHNLGKKVVAVSYDSFEAFAKKIFSDICAEAQLKFGGELNIALAHRVGKLNVGDASIVIAVSSPHRLEAYEASRYLIEQTKARAAIWKKEHYEDGETKWLRGHALCQHPGQAIAHTDRQWFK